MANTTTMNNNATENMNLAAAIQELLGNFQAARNHMSENINDSWEEYQDRTDESANIVKGAFFSVWDTIARVTGFTEIKTDILRIYSEGCNEETGKLELCKMAKEARACMDDHIEMLRICFMTEEADILSKLVHENSIFDMFAGTISWIAGHLARKAKKLFGIDDEKSIVGAFFRSVGGFANILWSGCKLVIETAKFAVSFVGAGILKVADFVLGIAKWIIAKIMGFVRKDEDDDCFDEDDYIDKDYECINCPHKDECIAVGYCIVHQQ